MTLLQQFLVSEDERIDQTHIPGIKVIQNKKLFCYGIDSVLLADFASCAGGRGFDLGTGNGIIPILMKGQSKKNISFTALEIQKKSAELAVRSVKLNGFESSIAVEEGNIKSVSTRFKKGEADFVVSNPPYMVPSRGRQSSNQEKMIARQELLCSLEDVVRAAAYLLKEEGHFFMVHRWERREEIVSMLKKNGFGQVLLKAVKPFADKEPTLLLVDAVSGADEKFILKDLKELVVYSAPGVYTDEVNLIYKK